MKSLTATLVALALFSPATWAAPKAATARDAIAALGRAKGAALLSNILLVSGNRGQDQPAQWRIFTNDPQSRVSVREFVVEKGRVTSDLRLSLQEAQLPPGGVISQRKLKIDTPEVFRIADAAARKEQLGFDNMDFALRSKELSQDPVYFVRLNDEFGRKVGELVVSGETGSLLRKNWAQTRQTQATGVPAPATRTTPDNGPGRFTDPGARRSSTAEQTAQNLIAKARYGFGVSKEAVGNGLQRALSGLRDFFQRGGSSSSSAPASSEPNPYLQPYRGQ